MKTTQWEGDKERELLSFEQLIDNDRIVSGIVGERTLLSNTVGSLKDESQELNCQTNHQQIFKIKAYSVPTPYHEDTTKQVSFGNSKLVEDDFQQFSKISAASIHHHSPNNLNTRNSQQETNLQQQYETNTKQSSRKPLSNLFIQSSKNLNQTNINLNETQRTNNSKWIETLPPELIFDSIFPFLCIHDIVKFSWTCKLFNSYIFHIIDWNDLLWQQQLHNLISYLNQITNKRILEIS